jgi:hypothetical protein
MHDQASEDSNPNPRTKGPELTAAYAPTRLHPMCGRLLSEAYESPVPCAATRVSLTSGA